MQDYADTELLLSRANVDQAALLSYAREAADFSTNHQLPTLDFAINHYGQPDVAMFDFTCMYASENAAMVRQRSGHKLLVALVGDSLLEVRFCNISCFFDSSRFLSFFFVMPPRPSYASGFFFHIWLLNLWYSLLSPALLANGHWHCPRLPGSHGLGLDG